jgi:hypothetical protein
MLYRITDGNPLTTDLGYVRLHYRIDGEEDFIIFDITGHAYHPVIEGQTGVSETFMTIRHQHFYMKVGVWYSEVSKSIIRAWYRNGWDNKAVYKIYNQEDAEKHIMAAMLYV